MTKKDILKKAIVLSASFILAIILVKPIGVSTEYSVASGLIEKVVNNDYKDNDYYKKDENKILNSIDNPINYNVLFVSSIPFGGLIAYLLNKRNNKVNNKKHHQYSYKEYIKLFVGGFLLLFGARLASGCTSGHMMSGIMQSSISGLIFAGFVFASGIIFSLLRDRRDS